MLQDTFSISDDNIGMCLNCRDSLLASLIDGVRASGNLDVHVRMTPTPRGKRLGPLEVRNMVFYDFFFVIMNS